MSLDLQMTMRRNAEEMQQFFTGLNDWEAEIERKDRQLRGIDDAAAAGAGAAGAADESEDEDEAAAFAEAAANRAAAAAGAPASDAGPSAPRAPINHDRYAVWDSYDAEREAAALDAQSAQELKREARRRKREAAESARARALAESRAAELRAEGNAAFNGCSYEAAVLLYTEALVLHPRGVAAYANRALALLKLGKWEEAEEDCSAALLLDARHAKALLRRAEARGALRDYDGAAADLRAVLEVEPQNGAARRALDGVLKEAAEARVRAASSAADARRTRVPVAIVQHDARNDGDAFLRALEAAGALGGGGGAVAAAEGSAKPSAKGGGAGGGHDGAARPTAEPSAAGSPTRREPAAAAAAAAAAGARAAAASQLPPPPSSLATFERDFGKLLARRPAERIAYLQRIPHAELEALLSRGSLSPDVCGVLADVLGALCEHGRAQMGAGAQATVASAARGLARMPRRGLAIAFLEPPQRRALHAAAELALQLAAEGGADAESGVMRGLATLREEVAAV